MNKKKRKKQGGFTLIELLAVVVILLAISVMAISSISAAIERNKEKQNAAKEDVLVSYAKLYYDSHKNSLGKVDEIPMECLTKEYDLTDEEKKDANGNAFTGCIKYNISAGKKEWGYAPVNECNPTKKSDLGC